VVRQIWLVTALNGTSQATHILRRMMRMARLLAALTAAVLTVAGCGGGEADSGRDEGARAAETRSKLNGADKPRPEDFPRPRAGQTMQELADSIGATGTQLGLATSVFTPGHNRIAFGVLSEANGSSSLAACCERNAGSGEIRVSKEAPVPDVGERAPVVSTDTVASAGSEEAVDTRRPTAPDLHRRDFKDVVGKKPVALLFATPQLCQSRVCGPVVDIALQLKEEYGDRVEFIHQEVYVDNEVAKGLREPLRRFGLPTEPWLFTIGTDGTVASRLEGSFGRQAFEKAVQAAIARSSG
jgi:hypothetical protein